MMNSLSKIVTTDSFSQNMFVNFSTDYETLTSAEKKVPALRKSLSRSILPLQTYVTTKVAAGYKNKTLSKSKSEPLLIPQ